MQKDILLLIDKKNKITWNFSVKLISKLSDAERNLIIKL